MYNSKSFKRPKKQQKGSKFFDNYIDRYGDNFLQYVAEPAAIAKLKRDMPRLIKDIAYGNVNINKYGKYFTPQFNLWLIEVVDEEYIKRSTILTALNLYCATYPSDSDAIRVRAEANESYHAYRIIYERIYALNQTGDLNNITVLPNALKYSYKNTI
jgi:hypothetical protein